MDLNSLLGKIKDAVFDDNDTKYQRGDSHGLIETIENLFGKGQSEAGTSGNPRPASQDPLGDPADQGGTDYPEATGSGTNVRPATDDPLGDPADQV